MENKVRYKIKHFYPDADFSSIDYLDLKTIKNLIFDRLTKSKFDDRIVRVKITGKKYLFDNTKEPCLALDFQFVDKDNEILNNIKLICYAFDVKIENVKDVVLQNICLEAWNKLMTSKFKRDYCDGLTNYIISQRVRLGESVAEDTSKRLREIMLEKYSIIKEETNQP